MVFRLICRCYCSTSSTNWKPCFPARKFCKLLDLGRCSCREESSSLHRKSFWKQCDWGKTCVADGGSSLVLRFFFVKMGVTLSNGINVSTSKTPLSTEIIGNGVLQLDSGWIGDCSGVSVLPGGMWSTSVQVQFLDASFNGPNLCQLRLNGTIPFGGRLVAVQDVNSVIQLIGASAVVSGKIVFTVVTPRGNSTSSPARVEFVSPGLPRFLPGCEISSPDSTAHIGKPFSATTGTLSLVRESLSCLFLLFVI